MAEDEVVDGAREDSTALTDGAAAKLDSDDGVDGKTGEGAEKADEGKGAEAGEGTDKGAEEKADAPIEYTDFSVPEGMQVDADALADFMPLAQDLKLSQDQAQKYVDIFAKGAERAAKANVKAWQDLKKTWNDEARADKDIGGEHYDDSIKLSKVFIKKWSQHTGNDKFWEALDSTGFGDHPEFIRLLTWVGNIVVDDDFDFGGSTGETPRTQAEIIYPDQGKT